MVKKLDLLQGTLDLLLLKAVSLGPLHGYESENKRKAKYYRLTASGGRALQAETKYWEEMACAIGAVLRARPEEV